MGVFWEMACPLKMPCRLKNGKSKILYLSKTVMVCQHREKCFFFFFWFAILHFIAEAVALVWQHKCKKQLLSQQDLYKEILYSHNQLAHNEDIWLLCFLRIKSKENLEGSGSRLRFELSCLNLSDSVLSVGSSISSGALSWRLEFTSLKLAWLRGKILV